MKRLLVLSTISMILLSGCAKEDEYKHFLRPGKANIILITGQSNASGNSPADYLQSKNPEIYNKFSSGLPSLLTSYYVHVSNYNDYFEPTRFGMADSKTFFGPEIGIADIFSDENEQTFIIKYAIGATKLDDEWLNGHGNRGKFYKDSVSWFKKKMNYLKSKNIEPKIIGQFWMQGEGDSFDPLCSKYESNLSNLISFYREDLKDYYDDHYTFVDAYISTKTIWPKPDVINDAKQAVADSDQNVFCIKTNGEDFDALNLNVKSASNEGDDQAHYDSISQLELGRRVGQIIKENK